MDISVDKDAGTVRVNISADLSVEQTVELVGQLTQAVGNITGVTDANGASCLAVTPQSVVLFNNGQGVAIGLRVGPGLVVAPLPPHTAVELIHALTGLMLRAHDIQGAVAESEVGGVVLN